MDNDNNDNDDDAEACDDDDDDDDDERRRRRRRIKMKLMMGNAVFNFLHQKRDKTNVYVPDCSVFKDEVPPSLNFVLF